VVENPTITEMPSYSVLSFIINLYVLQISASFLTVVFHKVVFAMRWDL